MPNWCSNNLRICGPAEDVRRFKEKAIGPSPWLAEDGQEKSALNFHNFVPIPPEVLSAGYNEAGYDWERLNWGCKWGACEAALVDECDGTLIYSFETAWAPPIPLLEKLAPEWPTLTFLLDYEEMGMGFKGITKFIGGLVEDHCVEL